MKISHCPPRHARGRLRVGDRAPGDGIGPALGQGTVMDDCFFFRTIDAKEEAF